MEKTLDFYTPYRRQTTSLHSDLAALPFPLCLSMTPERFLLNAFAQTPGKRPLYSFYHFWSPQQPVRHARPRDEAAITRGRGDIWPALKKGRKPSSTPS